MCGILLAVERAGPVDGPRFKRALDVIGHRGPDGEGISHVAIGNGGGGMHAVALGHRRLSILDLSDRSSQPFRRNGAALTYNGEIYNFRALRANLDAAPFTTDGDTEVLFEILRQRGVSQLQHAFGMWAFCHLDEASGRITAARDRLGKKPLFYAASATTIVFASEIAAITTYLGSRPRIAAGTVDTYLAYGWAMPGAGPATPLEDIRQVMPGCCVTVDVSTWTVTEASYIEQTQWAPVGRPPTGDLAVHVRAAVCDRMVSDRKIGLLLSGGIDSSLILSVLCAEGLQDQVHCFIGEAGKSDDGAYATQVTAALGVKAETVNLDYGSRSLDRFLSVCRHQAKPFPMIGNVLGLPELYERIAARGVPVVLDGTGADEVFAGYWERYYRFALAEAWDAGDVDWIAAMLSANADDPRIDALGRTTMAALQAGTWPPVSVVGAQPTAEIAPLLATFCDATVAAAQPADRLARSRLGLAAALHRDVTANLLPEWLWQNDRNAMRSGVENRSPFLDTRLTAYLGTGYQAKFNGVWNKHELRQLFDAFRPAPTQWRRQKQGFRWVFARFMRHNRAEILALIAASSIVRARVDTAQLIAAITTDEELLFSDLTQRCLGLAGVEAATGLGLA
jgi:asparagine synthase (glutamine-hydrolysing)